MNDATRSTLTLSQREEIRTRYAAAEKKRGLVKALAAEYGVNDSTIYKAIQRKYLIDQPGYQPPVKFDPNLEPIASEDFEVPQRQPKILFFDIETAPNVSYVWGHYEQNVLRHVEEWHMLAFSAKWAHEDECITKALPDYEGYTGGSRDDRLLCTELHSLLHEADAIVAHNGDSFDVKKSNARFLIHGLNPPAPYKQIDTKKVAKRYFRFNSNKLDDLGATLGLGRKLTHTGFHLWEQCMAGDPAGWATMKAYNEQDVRLLERVYLRMKPWMVSHPNMAILSRIENGCPNCASKDLVRSGWSLTSTGKKPRYQCRDCGAWCHGRHKKVTDIR